jgi:glycosyltransferase involved in cell wall biosynthesis
MNTQIDIHLQGERRGEDTKVAIVHDFLLAFGGAEKVLQSLVEMYPGAPVYTLLADPAMARQHFPGMEIRESFLSKFPYFLKRRHRWLLPLYPAAVEAFDLRDFDLVISSSGAWSKGIVTRLHTKHVAYIHSPMRYVWDENEAYLRTLGFFHPFRFLARIFLSYLRLWDKQAAERPDVLIANSEYTKERIAKYYRLPATVIYPPVSLQNPSPVLPLERGGSPYFLMVSRLTEAKKISVAIEAFNKSELPLFIVGDGPMRKLLQKQAKANIHFLGLQKEENMPKWYGEARALVHFAEEDFGLAMAEALASGTPVIAFDRGGARELVRPGIDGELFFAQTPEILSDGIRRFIEHESLYDREEMRHMMQGFSKEIFQEKIRNAVSRAISNS